MAEIRHLENRHDVIFLCRGWSDLDKISQTGTEWHVDCGDMWKSKPDVEFQYGGRLGKFSACHPRATYHIARCCHLVNSLSRFQSHMPHCRVQSPDEINATLQNVRIPSAILKIVFRHILFFLFLMQFRLWRAAAFVSSPIHLFVCLSPMHNCREMAWLAQPWAAGALLGLLDHQCPRCFLSSPCKPVKLMLAAGA